MLLSSLTSDPLPQVQNCFPLSLEMLKRFSGTPGRTSVARYTCRGPPPPPPRRRGAPRFGLPGTTKILWPRLSSQSPTKYAGSKPSSSSCLREGLDGRRLISSSSCRSAPEASSSSQSAQPEATAAAGIMASSSSSIKVAGAASGCVGGVRRNWMLGEGGCERTAAALTLLTSTSCHGLPLTLLTLRRPGTGSPPGVEPTAPRLGVPGAVMQPAQQPPPQQCRQG
mmetsp:Transcript_30120/g.86254  ORF Transcript_30120/g.86254 Transcript_30120/m.86254 type:complete len:225 (+) Transcript_30120:435-1109(+)